METLLVLLPFHLNAIPPLGLAILKSLIPEAKCLDLSLQWNERLIASLRIDRKKSSFIRSKFEKCCNFIVDDGSIKMLNLLYDTPLQYPNNPVFREMADEILKFNPNVVGFSTFATNLTVTLNVARILYQKGIKTILGGPSTLFAYPELRKLPYLDHIVVGEGENSFPKLIKDLRNGKKREKIVQNGRLVNLDEVPIPNFEDFDLEQYKYLPLETQRGCPYRCTFCNVRFHPESEIFRTKSFSKVRKEAHALKFYGKTFYLVNNTSNPSKQYLLNLSQALSKENIKWAAEMRANISEEECQWLKKSGCQMVALGIESFSDKVLNLIDKQVNAEMIVKTIKHLHKVGVHTHGMLIFGFPGENFIDVLTTLIRLLKYNKYFDTLTFSPFSLSKHSLVHRFPERFGIRILKKSWLLEKEPYEGQRRKFTNKLAEFIIHYFAGIGKIPLWKI